ncbi:MAG: hypothetical protein F4Y80_05760 [Caldilineaceae bacterium SB0665_bin_21]|nr:hypothetical protein [Caldilineaceae bacterium SB0665_bin_21]
MARDKGPQWHFAPTGGGVRQGFNNAGAEHFRSAPEEKLIREVIQNSLDARHPQASDPVEIDVYFCNIAPDDIVASQLKNHLLSCRQVMREKEQLQGEQAYAKALKLLRKPVIPALALVDRNTTGLTGSKWDSLVFEEGIPAKESEGAPGGSFGIGKNAPYNASELHTVIYSTLYSNPQQGRVEKMAGRAVLVSHPCPDDPGEMLQNIGFLTRSKNRTVEGTQIPRCFRLRHPGTGLWILGFRPDRGWHTKAARSAAENFFQAIHARHLVVNFRASASAVPDPCLRHDTVERMLVDDPRARKSDSLFFLRAVTQDPVNATRSEDGIGAFHVYLHRDTAAPNRVAYVNRRGMLITASKERRKSNPFHPRRGEMAGWAPFAAVVIAASDAADKQIRQLENPAHDEISLGRLGPDQRELEKSIQRASDQVTEILRDHLRSREDEALANLQELAHLFPDLDPAEPGNRKLSTRTIQSRGSVNSIRPATNDDSPDDGDSLIPNGADGQSDPLPGGGGTGQGTGGGTGGGSRKSDSAPRTIQDLVVMRSSPSQLRVALFPIGTPKEGVLFTLHPGGEEYRQTDRIQIEGIVDTRPASAKASLEGGMLRVIPNGTEAVTLTLDIDPSTPVSGYRYYERKDS